MFLISSNPDSQENEECVVYTMMPWALKRPECVVYKDGEYYINLYSLTDADGIRRRDPASAIRYLAYKYEHYTDHHVERVVNKKIRTLFIMLDILVRYSEDTSYEDVMFIKQQIAGLENRFAYYNYRLNDAHLALFNEAKQLCQ